MQCNVSGYSSLHHAAAWGKIDCLKILVDGGADLQLKTKDNERARETALRYGQTECVDYLDWAGMWFNKKCVFLADLKALSFELVV